MIFTKRFFSKLFSLLLMALWTSPAFAAAIYDNGSTMVGIKTTAPTDTLDINGTVRIRSGSNVVIAGFSGDRMPVRYDLEPATSFVKIDCQDHENCHVSITANNAHVGQLAIIMNAATSDGQVILYDDAHLSLKESSVGLDKEQNVTLIYDGLKWVEIARNAP